MGDFNLPNPTSPKKTFANHKDIKKTIIGTSMKAISETGTRYKYMIPLPVYDKEYQYFTIEFEKFEKENWDLFRLELSKEYFHQTTTIQREGDFYQIIYSETGE